MDFLSCGYYMVYYIKSLYHGIRPKEQTKIQSFIFENVKFD